jgi:hypothetical protein
MDNKTAPIFSNVQIDLNSYQGNAFYIIGVVVKCLTLAGYSQDEIETIKNDMMSKDYDYLCEIASKYIVLNK